jgi:periplasmic divalent cation tolerance protein
MTEYCSVYITAPDQASAESLARLLVELRLAACANIVPGLKSVYRWDGEIKTDDEVAIIAKTRKALAQPLIAKVRSAHPYDCPCIVTWPIEAGNPDYLDWIAKETASD